MSVGLQKKGFTLRWLNSLEISSLESSQEGGCWDASNPSTTPTPTTPALVVSPKGPICGCSNHSIVHIRIHVLTHPYPCPRPFSSPCPHPSSFPLSDPSPSQSHIHTLTHAHTYAHSYVFPWPAPMHSSAGPALYSLLLRIQPFPCTETKTAAGRDLAGTSPGHPIHVWCLGKSSDIWTRKKFV